MKIYFLSAFLLSFLSLQCENFKFYETERPETVVTDWSKKYFPNGIPQEIDDILKFINKPKAFTNLGAELPKGMLLYGPPGTGKTSIARAIAEELDIPFVYISGSGAMQPLVGLAAKQIRETFENARKLAERNSSGKAIVFIDEIDLVGKARSDSSSKGGDEGLTELLVQLDGLKEDNRVFVIAATNRPDILDEALLRGGRLEVHLFIPLPNLEERKLIINHYLNKIKFKGKKEISQMIAEQTEGLSGADFKHIINTAAIIAGRENASSVNEKHIFLALKKILRKKNNSTKSTMLEA